jgi:hypothetical protein
MKESDFRRGLFEFFFIFIFRISDFEMMHLPSFLRGTKCEGLKPELLS